MLKSRLFSARKLAIIGILGALTAILGMTPIGLIPVGPTKATIMHIPVIIGAIMEGPFVGGFIGLIFGIFSIYSAITSPTPISFAFLNPLVSVLPRILIGITSYYVYKALEHLGFKRTLVFLNAIWIAVTGYLVYGIYSNIKNGQSAWLIVVNVTLLVLTAVMVYLTNWKSMGKALDVILATIVGTLTNTGLVLTMIYLLYAGKFEEAMGLAPGLAGKSILGIGVANGIPEIIVAILIVSSVVSALKKQRSTESNVRSKRKERT